LYSLAKDSGLFLWFRIVCIRVLLVQSSPPILGVARSDGVVKKHFGYDYDTRSLQLRVLPYFLLDQKVGKKSRLQIKKQPLA